MKRTLYTMFFILAFNSSGQAKTIEFKQDFAPVTNNESLELFVPVPMNMPGYQKVLTENYFGNADSVKFGTQNNVRLLHAT